MTKFLVAIVIVFCLSIFSLRTFFENPAVPHACEWVVSGCTLKEDTVSAMSDHLKHQQCDDDITSDIDLLDNYAHRECTQKTEKNCSNGEVAAKIKEIVDSIEHACKDQVEAFVGVKK